MHVAAPCPDVLPTGHITQPPDSARENEFAPHDVHDVSPALEYRPAAHPLHVTLDADPAWEKPAEHVQPEAPNAPRVVENAGHGVQTEEPAAEYELTPHGWQVDDPAVANVPAAHCEHDSDIPEPL